MSTATDQLPEQDCSGLGAATVALLLMQREAEFPFWLRIGRSRYRIDEADRDMTVRGLLMGSELQEQQE